ncbi:MAG: FAD-dependent oxidoreductase [Coriobacteriales bacterium]|nr:FAD-dependent oxidoreductase [Coriobacteriales bacterium]
MNDRYPNLSSPIKIGSLTLRNRIVAAPQSQGDVENDGTLSLHNIAYFARKAKGGMSLVTVGDGIVDPSGQNHPKQVLLYTDACLPSLTRCAEEIHKYGALASIELSHGGIVCDPAFIGGQRPYGPSEVPVTIGFQTANPVLVMSQEMSVEFMDRLADSYAAAAMRVKRAGFDMAMLHAAHGWLIGQFFSPHTNKRTDEFGGSVENRARFAIMVLERIRKAVGPRFAIVIRMNGADGLSAEENGLGVEDACRIAELLEPYVDSFHISSCMHMYPKHQDIMQSPIFTEHGHLVHLAAEVKKHVSKPVCTVGGLSDIAMMEQIVASGQADIVAIGRQSLADPDFAIKGFSGREAEIRRCLRCATCQSNRFTRGTARCSLNPEIGREYELQFMPSKAEDPKRVMVVGGGPAGMEAAIVAAKRGHDVTLYEKGERLGGALNFAEHVDFKSELFHLVGSMEAELDASGAKVVLNQEVTPEFAREQQPDAIISALGADCIKPSLPGIDSAKVMMAEDAHRCDFDGERVVVIGGGLVGIEAALHLAKCGKRVTIVELLPDIANDANIRYGRTYRWELEKERVEVLVSTKCRAITEAGIEVEGSDDTVAEIPADAVVIAVGMRSREGESEALRDCAETFIPIGNCVAPGQVQQAIRAGYDAATFQI